MSHHNKKRNQYRHPKSNPSHIAGESPEEAKDKVTIGKGSSNKKGGRIKQWLTEN